MRAANSVVCGWTLSAECAMKGRELTSRTSRQVMTAATEAVAVDMTMAVAMAKAFKVYRGPLKLSSGAVGGSGGGRGRGRGGEGSGDKIRRATRRGGTAEALRKWSIKAQPLHLIDLDHHHHDHVHLPPKRNLVERIRAARLTQRHRFRRAHKQPFQVSRN